MIFYLIPAANGQPAELAGTQADARELCKKHGLKFNAETMTHDVPTSKWDLMNYVNVLMHERDGLVDPDPTGHLEAFAHGQMGEVKVEVEPKPSYVHQSLSLDEEWEKLSLERKLHFASLAMEDARARL